MGAGCGQAGPHPRGGRHPAELPNGAGKTTFFNLLTGFDDPDHGRWVFDGEEMNGIAAYKTARVGMVRTFQLTKSLNRLSVMQNMMLGAQHQSGERFWSSLVPATAVTNCDAAGQLGLMPPSPHSSAPESPVEIENV